MSSEILPNSTIINALQLVFPYCEMMDIVQCARVNTVWQVAVTKYIKWVETPQRNVHVYEPKWIVEAYKRPYIRKLDLFGLVFPRLGLVGDDSDYQSPTEFWRDFSFRIGGVVGLQYIKLRECPFYVLENLAFTNPLIGWIGVLNVQGGALNLAHLKRLTRLNSLYLKAPYHDRNFRITVGDGSSHLPNLNMRALALTGFAELPVLDLPNITNFGMLHTLMLGNCTNFTNDFTKILVACLKQLKMLRLERYRNISGTTAPSVFRTIANMPNLEHFEIIDFEITFDFEESVAMCVNLLKLLIVPNICDVSPCNNRRILCGIVHLRENLSHFGWIFPVDGLTSTKNYKVGLRKPLPVFNRFGEIEIRDVQYPPAHLYVNFKQLQAYLRMFLRSDCEFTLKTLRSPDPFAARLNTYLWL